MYYITAKIYEGTTQATPYVIHFACDTIRRAIMECGRLGEFSVFDHKLVAHNEFSTAFYQLWGKKSDGTLVFARVQMVNRDA